MSDTIGGRWRAYQTHPLPGLFNGEVPALQLRIAADDLCMQDSETPTTKLRAGEKVRTQKFELNPVCRYLPLVCCVEDADLLLWSMSYIHSP